MEGVFTLQYPEYVVAQELARHLPKGKGYSTCIPLSRQQRGMDLLVYSLTTQRAASIQVKSSRAYLGRPKKTDPREGPYDYYLWFKAFDTGTHPADFYAFVGIFPKKTLHRHSLSHRRIPANWWSHMVLLVPHRDVHALMRRVAGQADRFFDVGFVADMTRVAVTRGTRRPQDWEKFILKKSVAKLEGHLGAKSRRRRAP